MFNPLIAWTVYYAPVNQYTETIADSVTGSDTSTYTTIPNARYTETITESVTGSESFTIYQTPNRYTDTIIDSFTSYEAFTIGTTPNRYTDNIVEQITNSEVFTLTFAPNRYIDTINDSTTFSEWILGAKIFISTIADSLSWRDYYSVGFTKTATESATVSEIMLGNIAKVIKDFLWCYTNVTSKWVGATTIAESFSISESFWIAFTEACAETGTLTDTTTRGLGLGLAESLIASSTVSNQWAGTRTVAEILLAIPTIMMHRILPLLLEETPTASETLDYELAVLLREYLNTTESVTPKGTFTRSLSDLLHAIDALTVGRGYLNTLTESITTTEALAVVLYLFLSRSESVTVTDTQTPVKKSCPINTDSITITSTLTSKGTFRNILTDIITSNIILTLNGETYQCYSFAGSDMYASLYTNYGFNSFATLGDHTYGCKSTGIYLLEGDTDAGTKIETGVRLNYSYMGTHLGKRLQHAFFGLVGTDPVLKVILDNDDDMSVQYYVINNKVSHTSRGASGRKWELVLTNIDELQFIEITPIILSR